jgi:hypothetical protein
MEKYLILNLDTYYHEKYGVKLSKWNMEDANNIIIENIDKKTERTAAVLS